MKLNLLNKAIKTIRSCETIEQLSVASRYSKLVSRYCSRMEKDIWKSLTIHLCWWKELDELIDTKKEELESKMKPRFKRKRFT